MKEKLWVGCINCKWEYHDSPGMGVHRTPIECPVCGQMKIRSMPKDVKGKNLALTNEYCHKREAYFGEEWKDDL